MSSGHCISVQEFEDLWTFFKAKVGLRAKEFGKPCYNLYFDFLCILFRYSDYNFACHCFPMCTVCPSHLILLEVMTLIFNYLSQTGNQLYQQAVSIAQLVISVIQFLERASKVGWPLAFQHFILLIESKKKNGTEISGVLLFCFDKRGAAHTCQWVICTNPIPISPSSLRKSAVLFCQLTGVSSSLGVRR